jgi:hypothetical protein
MGMRRYWIVISTCILLAGCFSEPGKGKKAEQRFEQSAPIIAALERYHAKHGTYPDTLSSLMPDEMAKLPEMYMPSRDSVTDGGKYRRTGSSYELLFRYPEGGMNECFYRPGKEWLCHGWI